jgi:uncharacterized protein YbjQ (UPF0145 family)
MTSGEFANFPTSTTFDLPGYTVERTLGISWGLMVRSVGFAKGFSGAIRSLKAGEVSQYTDVVDAARETAVERLITHVQQKGGNAVLGLRFDSSDVAEGLAEVIAYGTAAVVRPI